MMSLQIVQIINRPVASNCYIIYDRKISKSCLIVDPGSENNKELISKFETLNLVPEYVILTHEHFDHCWGVNGLRNNYNIKVICSEICSNRINSSKKNLSLFYNQKGFEIAPADILIDNGTFLEWNKQKIEFFNTHGHTDSSISIRIGNNLFTGDALIKDQRTVTKLFTGSNEEQEGAYRYFKGLIGNHIIIYPGHGEIFGLDNYNINKWMNERYSNSSDGCCCC